MDIGIDLGKRKSYVVMEDVGEVVKEGYTETSKEGFEEFFGGVTHANVVVEASSSTNRVAALLEGHNITVANPMKVRVIAQSVKKTDKIDAHTLLDLYKKDYLPRSWLPDHKTRNLRDLCRNRDFLVRQRTAVKNRIRYLMYTEGMEFRGFNRHALSELKKYPMLNTLACQLQSLNHQICETNRQISREVADSSYAQLLYTIPGVGEYSALAISSEIGDMSRFENAAALSAYAGLVPRIRQSGDREWKGRITKGNVYLKTILVECVQVHIKLCPRSFITFAYRRILRGRGHNKAKIASARRLLELIYYMLKRNEMYKTND